jgi:hypothetical protein
VGRKKGIYFPEKESNGMKAEAKKLIEMVRKGIPDKEIMKELKIQIKK